MKKAIIFLFISLFLFNGKTSACHLGGGEITYRFLGNGQYEIIYTYFRDCSGINMPSTMTAYTTNSCSYPDQNITLNLDITSISNITDENCGPTFCDNGSNLGMEKHIYKGILILSAECDSWKINTSDCCRNPLITNFINPDQYEMFLSVTINNMNGIQNNSPVFTNDPVFISCINESLSIDPGITDIEGDSLVCLMTYPKTDLNDPLQYKLGYSAMQPFSTIAPVSFNSETGIIEFIPSSPEIGVIVIMVEEYRNGILISQIQRDIIFFVDECTDRPILSGINNTNEYRIDACPGKEVCFDIFLSSSLPDDNISISVINPMSGSTFVSNSGQFSSGKFCWTPSVTDSVMEYVFDVSVNTSRCTYNLTTNSGYTINLLDEQTCVLSDNSIKSSSIRVYSPSSSGIIIINMNEEYTRGNYLIANVTNSKGQEIINLPITDKNFSIDSRELRNEKVLFVRIIDLKGSVKHTEKIVRVE